MSTPGLLRVAAYLLAWLIAGAPMVARSGAVLVPDPPWGEPLQRAESLRARGDVPAGEAAWDEAYRAAMRSRVSGGLLDVGRAYLRIGEAARDHGTAVARARRLFLGALFRAREARDPVGVAEAAAAFAGLGDRAVADRAFVVALALAEQDRDPAARNRIAALRGRASAER
jgi:hypothetical protein